MPTMSAFTLRFQPQLDDSEVAAAEAIVKQSGGKVTWQQSAACKRTYGLVENAGAACATSLREATRATVFDRPVIALAVFPSVREALPPVMHALGGPGGPAGVLACEPCGDGAVVVRGDEHDVRGRGEAGQQPGEVQAVEPGHPDVQEHRVQALALDEHPAQVAQRGRGVLRAGDPPDPRVLAEQVDQFLQGGALIVDGKDVQHDGDFAVITVCPQSVPKSEYRTGVRTLSPERCPDGTSERAI